MNGGIFDIEDTSTLTINTSLFIGNRPGRNGGILDNISNNKFAAINCTFDGNNASGAGGVLQSYNGRNSIKNCMFKDNYGKII